MWVRGLKLISQLLNTLKYRSHPMWVRGLKLQHREGQLSSERSHPMWVRGLKLENHRFLKSCTSRILCGCVD